MTPEVWLLIVSLSMNLAALFVLVHVIRGRGGIAYLKSIVLKDNEATVNPGSRVRREMYASLPAPSRPPIVFLGDSITVACEWHEAYASPHPILNRAIGGDTSLGVLERIADICRLYPFAVFLMIGTNDPQMLGYSTAESCANIRSIIAAILTSSPACQVYLHDVLPSRVPKFNAWSAALNRELQQLADGRQVIYLKMASAFSDSAAALDLCYTYDGLHLNAAGYLLWREKIRPVLDELAGAQTATAIASA